MNRNMRKCSCCKIEKEIVPHFIGKRGVEVQTCQTCRSYKMDQSKKKNRKQAPKIKQKGSWRDWALTRGLSNG